MMGRGKNKCRFIVTVGNRRCVSCWDDKPSENSNGGELRPAKGIAWQIFVFCQVTEHVNSTSTFLTIYYRLTSHYCTWLTNRALHVLR